MKQFVPIIPCYNPTEKVLSIIDELVENGFLKIIVINDGSNYDDIFKLIEERKNCILLTHDVNMGKGVALKDALKYYSENLMSDYSGVVFIDCDGQHLVKDMINVGNKMIECDKPVLGVRDFSSKMVPFRSKFGNRVTSYVFKKMFGVYISDTQTGLRAIPNRSVDIVMNSYGDRFEYEINMLIDLVKVFKNIVEVNIDVIYIDNNKGSNFNPLKDSFRIYKEMYKRRKN